MNHWNIGKRITVGFVAVLAVTVLLGVFAVYQARQIGINFSNVANTQMPTLQHVLTCEAYVSQNNALIYKHMSSPSADDMTHLESLMAETSGKIDAELVKVEAIDRSAATTAALKSVREVQDHFRSTRAEFVKRSRVATTPEAVAKLIASARAEVDPISDDYIARLDQLAAAAAQRVDAASAGTAATISHTTVLTSIGTGFAVVLGGTLGFVIITGVGRRLRQVAASLEEGAMQVATAATQVSRASQSLAEGSSEQAASLEETSASLEEMSSMTKRNAENAELAKQLSGQTSQAADSCSADMTAMKAAMDEIKKSAAETSKIVKTIDEIAFQTNILALNAAVEAARAGEAGAGFAVVAEEVRNLAQRCAQSAKETGEKIEASVAKSDNGVQISGKVALSLEEIIEKAHKVDALIAEISSASHEQSQGISQVNTAISQMDKVTQSNAANAEETAAAAEELNSQSHSMQDSVGELRRVVDGSSSQPSAAAPAVATVPAKGQKPRKTTPWVEGSFQPAKTIVRRPTPVAAGDTSLDAFKDF